MVACRRGAPHAPCRFTSTLAYSRNAPPGRSVQLLAAHHGFEPQFPDPESGVLPLDEWAK